MPNHHYYALSVLLSAFLLFQVQPMIGKYVLPWFGGTPTVWSAVLLFFQAVLSAGYGYAYWLLRRLRERRQGVVHLGLLGLSIGLLLVAALTWRSPLTPDASWRPQGADLPIWGIFRVLAVSVGIPYFLLSANSTLMQAWYGRDQQRQTPYRLYALSNVGSLLALVSYPILFEPYLTLRAQAYLWSAAYLVFAASAGYLALRTCRRAQTSEALERPAGPPAEFKRPRVGAHLLWVALPACASTLLVSVSNQVTQEVAAVPFLWVLPLAIYLLTFILAFSGGRLYSRRLYLPAYFAVSLASMWMLVKWPPFSIVIQIAIYALLLFVCCMICHSELYGLRPHPRFLPSFYLMTAIGGAVGGIFVTLLAPYLFSTGLWELQWAVVACGALLTIVMQAERVPARRTRQARRRRPPQRGALKPAVVVSAVLVLLLASSTVIYVRAMSSGTLLASRD
ncbi:MAG: ferrichrome ABC transporter permease, partial [Anaerolineae bacterium]|nr:ferrichrome ABC transporter permease [Anaerolineae bacterium]